MGSKNKALVESSAKLAQQAKVVEMIEAKLEAAKLELVSLGPSQTEELKLKREDRLADFAMGQANRSEIEKLDQNLSEESAKDQKREEIKGSISGLSRKLEEAQAVKRGHGGKYRDAVADTLQAEAEKLGGEYIAAALTMCGLFRRLQAVAHLHAELHSGSSQFQCGPSLAKKLSVPAFGLDVFRAHVGSDTTVLAEAVDIQVDAGHIYGRDVDDERARQAELGVDLNLTRNY